MRERLWLPAIVSGFAMLALTGLVGSWQWHADHSAEALTPHGERLFAIACFATPGLPALGALWAALSRRIVTRLSVVLVLLFIVGLAVPFVFLGVLPPMFRGHFTKSITSPDGAREAHVRVEGLLGCHATIYVSARRGIWALPGESREVQCETENAQWLPDGGVELMGGSPKPFLLDFGPH